MLSTAYATSSTTNFSDTVIENMERAYPVALMLVLLCSQQGCAPLVVTGVVATGAVVAKDRRTTGTIIEDEAIELRISHAIREDEVLGGQAHINVTSYNEIVLLTGEAPTNEMRARAEQLARRADKVRQVHNEIHVAGPSSGLTRSSDVLITSKVKTRMLTEKDFESGGVKVVTEDGTVYLMGLVTRQEGRIASEITREVGGVERVVKLFEYTD